MRVSGRTKLLVRQARGRPGAHQRCSVADKTLGIELGMGNQ